MELRRWVKAETGRYAEVLGGLGPDGPGWSAAVPACPGWDVAALTRHLGRVHRMVVTGITTGAGPDVAAAEREAAAVPVPELAGWFLAGVTDLLSALDRSPDAPAWSFAGSLPGGRTVGFWQRRQVHENAVHRVDLEEALGCRTPVEAGLAADGVAEVGEVMVPLGVRGGRLELPPYAVALTASDTGASWTFGGAGDPVATVAAPAEALYLTLWHRRVDTPLTLTGDADAARALLALPLTP